jgi:hypothetical protein
MTWLSDCSTSATRSRPPSRYCCRWSSACKSLLPVGPRFSVVQSMPLVRT